MIPPQAMLMQPMLMHTIEATALLAPLMSSLALAAIGCGAVLVALRYDARRADPTGAAASGAARTTRTAPLPVDRRASGRVPRVV